MSNAFQLTEGPRKGLSGALFGIALLAAIARTVIQLKKRQALSVDDAFFAVACVCLCVSTVLFYVCTPGVYLEQQQASDPSQDSVNSTISIISKFSNTQKFIYADMGLLWTVVFSVKFSFLFFFKVLIKRLTNLIVYWQVVAWTSAVGFVYCICYIFIFCPYQTLKGAQCWTDPHNSKAIVIVSVAISLDILTDVMILAIPVRLLWAVKIRPRQKLRLGLSLCLGIFMIITALVKASAMRDSQGGFNIVWVTFWHYAEGCIAVLMVSLTAFRSLFVSQNPSPARPNVSPSWSSKLRRRRAQQDQDLQWTGLPSTPPATTLTGMRTYIDLSSEPPSNVEGPPSTHCSRIRVENGFSVQSEPA